MTFALALALAGGVPARAAEAPPLALFLGSSTTAGLGATRGDRRWTTLVCRYLGWRELNLGRAGSGLVAAARPDGRRLPGEPQPFRQLAGQLHPTRALVSFGANEALYRAPAAAFGRELESVGRDLTARMPATHVWLLAPQRAGAIANRRAPYDACIRAAAAATGAQTLELALATDDDELAEATFDGLHLNDLGHAAIADRVADAVVGTRGAPAPATTALLLPAGPAGAPGGPLAPGRWVLDLERPLAEGRLAAVALEVRSPGRVRIALMRPDGRGGFERVRVGRPVSVPAGTANLPLGGWWTLAGDRLAVWSDRPCLASLRDGRAAGVADDQGSAPTDWPAGAWVVLDDHPSLRPLGPAAAVLEGLRWM